MYKICKTEQSAARQRQLEQILLSQMLQRHFEDISISDLCDGVGVPRKAFYRYFSGKRGALHALIDHTLYDFDSLTIGLLTGKGGSSRQFLSMYFRFWQNQKQLLEALDRSHLWEELMERSVMYACEELNRRKHPSVKHPNSEGLYVTRFTMYGLTAVLQQWYRSGFTPDESQMASLVYPHFSTVLSIWTT